MPDSQTLVILVAAMVAGVVLFRLYTVLGRRTGHEPRHAGAPRRDRMWRPGTAVSASAQPSSVACWISSWPIRNFDAPKFLAGARTAYAQIVTAFAEGDRAALKPAAVA